MPGFKSEVGSERPNSALCTGTVAVTIGVTPGGVAAQRPMALQLARLSASLSNQTARSSLCSIPSIPGPQAAAWPCSANTQSATAAADRRGVSRNRSAMIARMRVKVSEAVEPLSGSSKD